MAIWAKIGVVAFTEAQKAEIVSVGGGKFAATPLAPLENPPTAFHRPSQGGVEKES